MRPYDRKTKTALWKQIVDERDGTGKEPERGPGKWKSRSRSARRRLLRVSAMSSVRSKILALLYMPLKRLFLHANPFCSVNPGKKATDIHHTRGRNGPLLLDIRFWKGVSRDGHRWIDNNPSKARAMGLLCAPGEWNTPPEDEETNRLRQLIRDIQ